MKLGPKAAADLSPLSDKGIPVVGPERVIAWIHRYGVVPHGRGALKPFRLREWQQDIIRAMYADPRPRAGLVSLPRGNGKSALAAALALYELFGTSVASPQVLCVASDERQAGIVFGVAKRMIELQPELAARTQFYKDHVRVPMNDGELRPLPSQAAALQGYRPTFAVVDELHVVTADVWEAIVLAAGKTDESLALAISTPGDDRESVMWRLVEHGRNDDDPLFRLVEFSAPLGCALDDETAWAEANPALGDFLKIDALRSNLKTARESRFRRYRLGQWVGQESAWLQFDVWQANASPREIAPGTPIVLGFDGSYSDDSTGLVGCTLDEHPHVFVVGSWVKGDQEGWRVPHAEVSETVAAAFERWDVRELSADPWGWRAELELWSQRWPGRVVDWPTSRFARMGPATDRMYQAVVTNSMTHDGNETLAAHVSNAVAKSTSAGDVITKDAKNSPRKIDLTIAAIVAMDRAAWHRNNQPQPMEVLFA